MKRRISIVSLIGVLAVVILFVLTAFSKEQQPGLGIDVLQIPWGQVLSLIGVMTAIFAFVQWLITVTMIQPQIRSAVNSSSTDVRAWVGSEFTPKRDFEIQKLKMSQFGERLSGQISDVAHDQSKDSERIAILHDKVILNDQRLMNHDQRIVDIERRRSQKDGVD